MNKTTKAKRKNIETVRAPKCDTYRSHNIYINDFIVWVRKADANISKSQKLTD